MELYEKCAAFAGRHGISINGPDIGGVIDALLYDMRLGLKELNEKNGESGKMTAAQEMIPTWTTPPQHKPVNENVIVIDAGGTNFRTCLVSFDASGAPSISALEKSSMPGTEREYSKNEFFDTIASKLDYLKNKASKIGFCFSYAMKITPDNDGQVIRFSKEIRAKEVVGSFVGASLSDALVKRGWERPEKIVLLNDTAAALLAGASHYENGRRYSSYAGLILGTGLNTAYIEYEAIDKIRGMHGDIPSSQIIVCESGMFDKIARSDFDIAFDKTTQTPGRYIIEKMCSGAYLGAVVFYAVKEACCEGLFSAHAAEALSALKEFTLYDMDRFLYTPYRSDTLLGAALSGSSQNDYDTLYFILDMFVERCARLTAALIAAAVIKTGKGKNPSMPVSVLCEGTTFYKTHNLRSRILGYLHEELMYKRRIYYEIRTLDNAIVLGAAVAALSV
ncbi:hexokinase [Treponema sp. OMZ 840]|uniref:hexokinase n=1 Tax=Treponema sp. OMZ 840 TaxID=244313 RepID=UPI003D902715